MECLIGIIAIILLTAIFVGFGVIVRAMACENCPRKEKCEKQVLEKGTALCDNNDHLHMIHHNNNFLGI